MKKKTLLGIVFTIVAMLSFAAVVNDNSFDSTVLTPNFSQTKAVAPLP